MPFAAASAWRPVAAGATCCVTACANALLLVAASAVPPTSISRRVNPVIPSPSLFRHPSFRWNDAVIVAPESPVEHGPILKPRDRQIGAFIFVFRGLLFVDLDA